MATPKKGQRFGRDPKHQRLIVATMANQFFETGAIETTFAKAKFMRPILEQLITKIGRAHV